MSDVKGPSINQINQMLKSLGINQNGNANIDKLVNSIFSGALRQEEKNELKSIFETYAQKDGNTELSAEEYMEAVDSAEGKAIISKLREKTAELFKSAKWIGLTSSMPNENETFRDVLIREKGEYFVTDIYDPLQKMLDEASEYAAQHEGRLDGYSFTGIPHGVKLLYMQPTAGYNDASNDVMQVVDGQPQVTRNADYANITLVCEIVGDPPERYIMSSKPSKELTQFVRNSYIEGE